MLLKGSSAARAGRWLHSAKGRALYLESAPLAARSSITASSLFSGRLPSSVSGALVAAVRSFADGPAASRPKAHTGRVTTTTRRPRTPAVKPAAAGSRGRTKTTTKKRATKGKAKAKAKPKAKPKRKAVLTPEAKQRNEVRRLKQKLLPKAPKQLPATAFLVINVEHSKGRGIAGREAASAYRNLSSAEREQYNHIANENKIKNVAAYKRWVHTFSPTDVKRANEAGRRLVRLGARKHYTEVRDDRKPKQSRQPYNFFVRDRFASADFAGVRPTEAVKLIATEWKQLSSSQKQKYNDEAKADQARYAAELKQAYGS